jgi:5-methylcytosine-specific restriction endonuclease McrA
LSCGGYRRDKVSDRRYSTARWQRLRKAVLAHYGYVCQLEGPRCTGYASSVHHLVPSSQAPHLFWEPTNLVAACPRCNYGDGSRVAAENTRRTIERLRSLVEQQQQQIAQMAERLARYEDPEGVQGRPAKHPAPAIH